jgi:hypothetical protein
MRGHLIGLYAAAIIGLCGHATDTAASGGTFTRGCAARDMQVMMMIEASPISAQQRTDAVLNVLHARLMCFDGYVVDALAVYDNVAQSIHPD